MYEGSTDGAGSVELAAGDEVVATKTLVAGGSDGLPLWHAAAISANKPNQADRLK